MLVKDIFEGTNIDLGIELELKRQGYKFLGAGVDQQAWLAKDGTIIKIFGTHGKTLSSSHQMFMQWKKFCDKWKSKTHLVPHHIDFTPFEYNGNTYLQIRMERLFKLTSAIENYIEEFIGYVVSSKSKAEFKRLATEHVDSSWRSTGVTASMGAIEDIDEFYDVIKELNNIANRNDWHFDLHGGNLMLDDQGYLVIIDPWHVADEMNYWR